MQDGVKHMEYLPAGTRFKPSQVPWIQDELDVRNPQNLEIWWAHLSTWLPIPLDAEISVMDNCPSVLLRQRRERCETVGEEIMQQYEALGFEEYSSVSSMRAVADPRMIRVLVWDKVSPMWMFSDDVLMDDAGWTNP